MMNELTEAHQAYLAAMNAAPETDETRAYRASLMNNAAADPAFSAEDQRRCYDAMVKANQRLLAQRLGYPATYFETAIL